MIGGITRFDPAQKNYLEWAHKVCNFLSMSTVESKADRAQSKQRKHKRLPWVYCATNSWLFFPVSRNKQIMVRNKAMIFLEFNQSFIDKTCQIKVTGY